MTISYRRFFAHHYDAFMAPVERRSLGEVRRSLLARTSGRILEIGAGTGANLPFYPTGLQLWVSEPDREMRRELKLKLQGLRQASPTLIAGASEHLPLPTSSMDFVVATLVLCSVQDPDLASREIRRVLRPGGWLLFIEHVRSQGAWGPWQDRLQPAWSRVGCGCHPNRETVAILRRAGFELDDLQEVDPFQGLPRAARFLTGIVRPFIRGAARRI
ncbi:MAG: methyltransferase domain-containing protein [Acidobacteriota bacterium]